MSYGNYGITVMTNDQVLNLHRIHIYKIFSEIDSIKCCVLTKQTQLTEW